MGDPMEKGYYTEQEFDAMLKQWDAEPPIKLIDHVYTEGCCDQPKDLHRSMNAEEFEAAFPLVIDTSWEANGEHYRLDARRYPDGIGVCFTHEFPPKEGELDPDRAGLCLDFPVEAVPGLRTALSKLMEITWTEKLRGN